VRYQPLRVSISNGHEIQAERELMRKPRNPLVVLIVGSPQTVEASTKEK